MRCDNCNGQMEPNEDGLCLDCIDQLLIESGIDSHLDPEQEPEHEPRHLVTAE
jgi:hypothetical protein